MVTTGYGEQTVMHGVNCILAQVNPAATHSSPAHMVQTAQELTLDFTLPTGQSFRWRQTQPHEYTGVIGDRLVRLQQEQGSDVRYQVLARVPGSDPALDAEAIREYFNMPR